VRAMRSSSGKISVSLSHGGSPIKIAPARIDAKALKVPVNWALLALPVGRHRIT
jgi:hypothetical protein